MTREDFIKSLIKSHGYTLKAFAQQISMPYTTLLSILNGSLGGAALLLSWQTAAIAALAAALLSWISGRLGASGAMR